MRSSILRADGACGKRPGRFPVSVEVQNQHRPGEEQQMTAISKKSTLSIVVLTATIVMLAAAAGAYATAVKPVAASRFGAKVDATTGGDVCTVASMNVCQPGERSTIPGGFSFPGGVAVAPSGSVFAGDVYVTDTVNARVQELTATGAFVRMFGWEVNETKDHEVKATQAEKNVCTEEEIKTSGVKCKAGVLGTAPGQFDSAASVTVDTAGDVYVAEAYGGHRVQKFTAEGRFVLEIGKEVNETTKGNLCTQEEIEKTGVKCTSPSAGGGGDGAFSFPEVRGNLLAVGGPEGLLYVGDEGRVQEFEADGKYRGDIPLAGNTVAALAVDGAGDVYVAYENSGVVHELNANGDRITEFGAGSAEIIGMALDSSGVLALDEFETSSEASFIPPPDPSSISLYDAATGRSISEVAFPQVVAGVSFGGEELYAADAQEQEIEMYSVVPVAETVTGPPTVACAPGVEHETSVMLACTLTGEINPQGVAKTVVWFQYGTSELALASSSDMEAVASSNVLFPVTATVGLRPDQAYYYRVAAEDINTPGESVHGSTVRFTTPSVPPRVECGEPEAFDVTFSTAVLSCAVNPENASTAYRFQYGPCESLNTCASLSETAALQSSTYGMLGVLQSATGLLPSATYHYRLVAANEHEEEAVGREGSFTTPSAPAPSASTGPADGVSATGALLSGTADPDGAGATYAFQVGIYRGAGTVYSNVVSGPTGSGVEAVPESFTLTGLQPGVTYAYRITITSAYTPSGESVAGEPVLFTTTGLPSALFAPATIGLLQVPEIAFPQTVPAPETKQAKTKKAKTKKTKSKETKSKKAKSGKGKGKRSKGKKAATGPVQGESNKRKLENKEEG